MSKIAFEKLWTKCLAWCIEGKVSELKPAMIFLLFVQITGHQYPLLICILLFAMSIFRVNDICFEHALELAGKLDLLMSLTLEDLRQQLDFAYKANHTVSLHFGRAEAQPLKTNSSTAGLTPLCHILFIDACSTFHKRLNYLCTDHIKVSSHLSNIKRAPEELLYILCTGKNLLVHIVFSARQLLQFPDLKFSVNWVLTISKETCRVFDKKSIENPAFLLSHVHASPIFRISNLSIGTTLSSWEFKEPLHWISLSISHGL